jgi:LysR family hydrogen peroxide-inducible transcriptional activator
MKLAPLPFTLRQLQYVVAVADELSFRRAAERCRVAQPSLSTQLAELEEALGVQLFERDRRRVLVTDAGKVIVERARRLLVDAEDLRAAAETKSDPLTGTYRIGVLPTIAPYLLPPVAPKLRTKFPKMRLLWVEDRTEGIRASLASGDLDAGVVALEADLGEVEVEILGTDAFVLAGSPIHPLLSVSGPLKPTELRGEEVLLLSEGHCFREQALEVCSTARAHEGEFRATSLMTLVQMVAAGDSVTLLPAVASRPRRSAQTCARVLSHLRGHIGRWRSSTGRARRSLRSCAPSRRRFGKPVVSLAPERP